MRRGVRGCRLSYGKGPPGCSARSRASFGSVESVPFNMRKYLFVFVCVAICMPAWAHRASNARKQTSSSSRPSSSSSKTTHSHSTTTAKKTSTRRRRRRSTRFVPRQKAPTADRIIEIQTALAHGGYYQSQPNGKWDSSTIAALQKFQSANGIEPTGKLDAPSLQKLGLGSDIAGVSAPRPVGPAGQVPNTSAPPQDSAPKPPTPAASSITPNAAGATTAEETQQPASSPPPPAPAATTGNAAKPAQQ